MVITLAQNKVRASGLKDKVCLDRLIMAKHYTNNVAFKGVDR